MHQKPQICPETFKDAICAVCTTNCFAALCSIGHRWFFLSPTIDHFSPSQTCFLQIQAHCMYLLFGARLAPIGIWYRMLVLQQLLMKVSCVLVHARCSASHKTAAYTLSFFEIRGRTVRVALDSPVTIIKGWILQTARHSNNSPARRDRAVYKL